MIKVEGTTITLTRGDTWPLTVEAETKDGNPYELQDGEYIELVVKRKNTDNVVLLRKVADNNGTIYFERADTWGMKAGIYEYQVRVENGTNDFRTFIEGNFVIGKVVDDAAY